jgi:hypothetical protein
MRKFFSQALVLAALSVSELACSSSDAAKADAGTASDDGAAGMSGAGGAAEAGPLGPPVITNVLVSGVLNADTASVTLTVDVTDPDGLDDIVGGKLFSPDKQQFFGAFSQLSGGTFDFTLSWKALNDAHPVVFAKGSSTVRYVLIEFNDASGLVGSMQEPLSLSCAVCGPDCVGCGTCKSQATCAMCEPAPSTTPKTCNDFCAAYAMTCACGYPSCAIPQCYTACDAPCPSDTGCACGCT